MYAGAMPEKQHRKSVPNRTENADSPVAALRHELGLTQQQFADAMGVSKTPVSLWACGAVPPSRMVTAAELKPDVVELPLETADETTALIRCGFLLRTLRKLGRRIVGRLADYAEALAPPKPEQKHGANVPGYVLSPRPRLDKEGARGDNED